MIHATQSKNPEFWIGFTDILSKMPSAVFPTNQAQTIFSEPLGHGESVGVLRFEIHWEMVELDIQTDIPVYRALVYYRYRYVRKNCRGPIVCGSAHVRGPIVCRVQLCVGSNRVRGPIVWGPMVWGPKVCGVQSCAGSNCVWGPIVCHSFCQL